MWFSAAAAAAAAWVFSLYGAAKMTLRKMIIFCIDFVIVYCLLIVGVWTAFLNVGFEIDFWS